MAIIPIANPINTALTRDIIHILKNIFGDRNDSIYKKQYRMSNGIGFPCLLS